MSDNIVCAKCGKDITDEGAIGRGDSWWCVECYEMDIKILCGGIRDGFE